MSLDDLCFSDDEYGYDDFLPPILNDGDGNDRDIFGDPVSPSYGNDDDFMSEFGVKKNERIIIEKEDVVPIPQMSEKIIEAPNETGVIEELENFEDPNEEYERFGYDSNYENLNHEKSDGVGSYYGEGNYSRNYEYNDLSTYDDGERDEINEKETNQEITVVSQDVGKDSGESVGDDTQELDLSQFSFEEYCRYYDLLIQQEQPILEPLPCTNCYISPPPDPKDICFEEQGISIAHHFSKFVTPVERIAVFNGENKRANVLKFIPDQNGSLKNHYSFISCERTDANRKVSLHLDYSKFGKFEDFGSNHSVYVFAREVPYSYNKGVLRKFRCGGKEFKCEIGNDDLPKVMKEHVASYGRFIFQNEKIMEFDEIEQKGNRISIRIKNDHGYKNAVKCNDVYDKKSENYTLKRRTPILEVCVVFESDSHLVAMPFLIQYYGGSSSDDEESEKKEKTYRDRMKVSGGLSIKTFVIPKKNFEHQKEELLGDFKRGLFKYSIKRGLFSTESGVQDSWFHGKTDDTRSELIHIPNPKKKNKRKRDRSSSDPSPRKKKRRKKN